MSEPTGFRRLRNYMMALFIPLTGVPLFILAVLAYFLISEAVNREIIKRSGPEISAVSRNLDTMERRMEKILSDMSRRASVQESIIRGNRDEVAAELRSFLAGAPFERLRAFSLDGELLGDVRARDSKKLNEQWSQFFGPRSQENLKEKSALYDLSKDKSRTPAAQASGGGFDFSRPTDRISALDNFRLTPNFLKHLKKEDFFGVRELSLEGSLANTSKPSLDLVQYKLIFDSVYRPLGFVEARLSLDPARLKILADYQGVDLLLLDSSFRSLASSNEEIEQKISTSLASIKESLNPAVAAQSVSKELLIKREPVEFFFTPLNADASDSQSLAGWMGVGLNKRAQIQLRNQVIFWIALLATVLAGVVVMITIRLSDRITQPISELLRATEMMKQGEWVHPVDSDTRTEIGVLVKRFNEMAQSVQVTKRTLELKLEELASAHGELTKTQGQLVQSAKMSSLGQLVAGVAHELNNPIAFIYSNMTQMRSYLKNLEKLDKIVQAVADKIPVRDSDALKKALEDIEWDYVRHDMSDMVQSCLDGSVRVKDIVLGLRNFSRLDKGEVAEVDANQMLENTTKLLNSQIKNRIDIVWDLCKDARMRANTSQINQVFMNILANGLQAIDGKGKVWIKTWVDVAHEEDFMNISFRDSGRGIKPDHIDKIFDPFFTTKKVGEGTGLGLSIVYGIIERHRGTIQVKSRQMPDPDHGTEFLIRFPRWAAPQNLQEKGSAA